MIGVSEFCKQPTQCCKLWQMCYLMDKKQFWKKDESVYSRSLKSPDFAGRLPILI